MQWLKIACVGHVHRNDTVGQIHPEAILKRWDSSGNMKIHTELIKYCHFKLIFKILFKKINQLCLINDRNFDSVVAIYDSNWYIKRLNNIKID